MFTEELINDADEKVRSLCVENKRLRVWFYLSLGVLSVLVFMLIYFSCYVKFYNE